MWVILALPSMAGAQGAGHLRLESGFGIDTNIAHVEESPDAPEDVELSDPVAATPDTLVRVVLDAGHAARLGRWSIRGDYHGGAKRFSNESGEDALFQHLGGSLDFRVSPWLALGAGARLRDRSTRDSIQPRDFLHVDVGPRATLALLRARLTIGVHGRRLVYAPDGRSSYTGLAATAALRRGFGAWSIGLHGGLEDREFVGDRFERGGQDGARIAIRTPVPGSPRQDRVSRLGTSVEYYGPLMVRADLSVWRNDSNSFGLGLTRYVLRLDLSAPLPLGLLASARGSLQELRYDERQPISPTVDLADESRPSVTLRLERPITDHWSAVAHLGTWFSFVGAGPHYDRQLAVLGVAWHHAP
jgi:hypothetical protein